MDCNLTFETLRKANRARRVRDKRECKDWVPAQWFQALIGELGEYANIRKKVERGDFDKDPAGEATARLAMAEELADAQAYLDLLAQSVGVALGPATLRKFNVISERIGSPVFLKPDGSDWFLETS